MINPVANRTLELACTVGSLDAAREALAEGAEVNFHSGSPLFLAIIARNRPIINFLLDHGAESAAFIATKTATQIRSREDLVEELMACAPYNPRDLKIEELQEIDSGIRDVGVKFLFSELDWDNATRFRDTLNAIGAGSKHRCVAEFLQWARSESRAGSGIESFLDTHNNAVSEYRDRYLSTGEDLIALASDFLNSSDGSDAD